MGDKTSLILAFRKLAIRWQLPPLLENNVFILNEKKEKKMYAQTNEVQQKTFW